MVSGNLSLEVGGPLQFDPKPMDEEFDDRAVDWISRGDIDTAIRGGSKVGFGSSKATAIDIG